MPDEVPDTSVADVIEGPWEKASAETPEVTFFLGRWDRAVNDWSLFGEAIYHCEHEDAVTVWFPRFEHAVVCRGCAAKILQALTAGRDWLCDSCGELTSLAGSVHLGGASMLAIAVFCSTCSPYVRDQADQVMNRGESG